MINGAGIIYHSGSLVNGENPKENLPDIVSADNKKLGIFVQKIDQLEEIVGLPGSFVFP